MDYNVTVTSSGFNVALSQSGAQGTSAYAAAVAAGYVGSEATYNTLAATLPAVSADVSSKQTLAATSATQAAAYRDSAVAAWAASTAPTESLAAMSQSIHSGNVVKAIIYDTSRDSDGGAWRKRCTHTSWYIEALGGTNWLGQKATAAAAWGTSGAVTGSYFQNTTDGKFYQLGASSPTVAEVFRGNVREFPALVAVVAETARVVIYDLTQPGAPMWMVVLTSPTGGWLNTRAIMNQSITSVAAFDGCVVIAQGVVDGGLTTFNFVSDTIIKRIASSSYGGRWSQGIGYRNTTGAYSNGTSTGYGGIIHPIVNDVALTTLPDAPIDPATGLPVPTIAVATAGGVSRIAHDGTVSSTSTANAITSIGVQIGCTPIYFIATFGTNGVAIVDARNPLPSGGGGDLGSYWGYAFAATWGSQFLPRPADFGALSLVSGGVAAAGTPGLLTRKPNPSLRGSGMVAAITNRYNSGWQVGDSRGAWLADTVAESITAPELVTNGTFATNDLTGWTNRSSGTATASASTGSLVLTNGTPAAGNIAAIDAPITCVIGKSYIATIPISSATAGVYLTINVLPNSTQTIAAANGTTTFSLSFVATATTHYVALALGGTAAATASIDNISVKLSDPDRSVKNNGLNIVGTLTKTAVASGAQLVAYSGFSASNYLEQPYSANFDTGAGDFSWMGWINAPTLTSARLIARSDKLGTAHGTNSSYQLLLVAGVIYFQAPLGNVVSGVTVPTGVPVFLCFTFSNGVIRISLNGVRVYFTTVSLNIVGTGAPTVTVGTGYYNGNNGDAPFAGSMALWRFSATAPSADQIAHIYRTELPLFQPGAQCTLAGTAKSISSMDFDESTEILHAVTSWGRSGFKDLLRVDSEATTVGALTSVSAKKGMILLGGTSAKVYQPALLLRDELRRKEEAKIALGKVPEFFNFDTISFAAATTSGSNLVTASSVIGTPYVGMGVTGAGIPSNTTLLAINGTSYTLSANATATATGVIVGQSTFDLQKGFTTKAVYSGESLKREGTTKTYVRTNNGFYETIEFAVSPGASAWVSIMAVRV